MRFLQKLTISLGLLFVATTVTARKAQAHAFYVDFQPGLGQFRGTDGLFGTGSADSSDYGVSLGLGLYYNPFGSGHGFEFQFGLQNQFLTATQGVQNYTLDAPYAVMRFQVFAAYASVGFAPLVFKRSAVSPGVEGFGAATGTFAYLGELGILYSATPKFSLGGSVTGQFFSSPRGFSSLPAASLNFVMRFYFDLFGSGGGGNGSGGSGSSNPLEYNGFRYIGK